MNRPGGIGEIHAWDSQVESASRIAPRGMSGSSAPLSRIDSVHIHLMSPEEIERAAVVEVTHHDTFDGRALPREDGVGDPRMGGVDLRQHTCPTDGNGPSDCPGYFGFVRLAVPVYNNLLIGRLNKTLGFICKSCGRLMVTDECMSDPYFDLSDDTRNRKRCPRCSEPVASKNGLTAATALELLEGLTTDEARVLGFRGGSLPSSMIVRNLPVPPPQIRPPVYLDGSRAMEDHLTSSISTVVSVNNRLSRAFEGGDNEEVLSLIEDLQHAVDSVLTSDGVTSSVGTSSVVSRSTGGGGGEGLCQRISGKGGHIRGNAMGKRVNYSGRTVITGDPNLGIGEIGVPACMAAALTVPENVTRWNSTVLEGLMRAGMISQVTKADSSGTLLTSMCSPGDPRLVLGVGDVVHRQLRDGDMVIFNRQPSLHKMSMMAHKVRILPGLTLRMNPCVTKPYNADFDGDEMNIHVPQSKDAIAEMKQLMSVSRNMVSPQSNKPVVGAVQDICLGAYMMTGQDVFLDRAEACQVAMAIGGSRSLPPPAVVKPLAMWTGSQVLSLALPTEMELRKGDVLISGGCIIRGRLCSKTLGDCSGGLVHVAWIDFGPDACASMLDAITRGSISWLGGRCASLGIADMMVSRESRLAVRSAIDESFGMAAFEASRPGIQPQDREFRVNAHLNAARAAAGRAVRGGLVVEESSNCLMNMVLCGSKGSLTNVAQISGCVGQQNVDGRRIAPGVCSSRTLSCFEPGSRSPESMGFVKNSYMEGLDPAEFFFHAMGGREGLVDTAVKTSTIGYMQRSLVKFLEDVRVSWDGGAFDASGVAIQPVYGGDGMDGAQIEPVAMPELLVSDREFSGGFSNQKEMSRALSALREARVVVVSPDEPVYVPLDPERAYLGACRRSDPFDRMTEEDAGWAMELLFDLMSEVEERIGRGASAAFRALVSSRLKTDRVCSGEGPSREQYSDLLDTCRRRFMVALASPGEAVGVLAAQSIGEPATQMCLNTFHWAGVSAKNVNLGIPRLTELFRCSQKCKTPCIEASLDQHGSPRLKRVLLSDVLRRSTEVLTEDLSSVVSDEAFSQMEERRVLCGGPECNGGFSTVWELDPLAMEENGIGVADIIRAFWEPGWFVRSTSGALSPSPYLSWDGAAAMPSDMESVVCGVGGVLEVSERDSKEWRRSEDGSAIKVNRKVLEASCDPEEAWTPVWKGGVLGKRDPCTMASVMAAVGVDHRTVVSNRITEVMRTLGVEAAREVMFREIRKVMEFDGKRVDPRHVYLVCDVMTASGCLVPINRHGLKRSCSSVLTRASFEETARTIVDAAVSGKVDDLKSVSSNVMLGRRVNLGTGIVDILVDFEEARGSSVNPQGIFRSPPEALSTTNPREPERSGAKGCMKLPQVVLSGSISGSRKRGRTDGRGPKAGTAKRPCKGVFVTSPRVGRSGYTYT